MKLVKPFRSIVEYVQGAYAEFRRVTWPTREAVIRYTLLVIATVVVSGLIITAFDYGMKQLTDRYLFQ